MGSPPIKSIFSSLHPQFGQVPYETCMPYEACSAESHEGVFLAPGVSKVFASLSLSHEQPRGKCFWKWTISRMPEVAMTT